MGTSLPILSACGLVMQTFAHSTPDERPMFNLAMGVRAFSLREKPRIVLNWCFRAFMNRVR